MRRRKIITNLQGIFCLLAAMLCAAGIFFARDWLRAAGRAFYPRLYSETVQEYAARYGVDENIVYAVIRTESGFRPRAESDAGARGLMQITEETFSWIKSKIAPGEELTFNDLFDPAVNIRFGAYYLSVCLARYDGDLSTAAAAYHSGMGTVDGLLAQQQYSADGRRLNVFPYRQMSRYVEKINKHYQRYLALYAPDKGAL